MSGIEINGTKKITGGVIKRFVRESALPARSADLKKRFMSAKTAIEAMGDGNKASVPAAIAAVLDLILLSSSEIPILVNHPATRESHIGEEITQEHKDLKKQAESILISSLKSITSGNISSVLGEILKYAEVMEKLVKKLALLHRVVVSDYYGALDPFAPFPAYRYSAASRSRVSSFRQPPPEDGGKAWSTKIGGLIWPTAVVDRNGDLYTGHVDGEFVALHPDGSIKWRIHDEQMMYIDSTGALGKDGFLYMASTDVDPNGHQNQGRIWKIDPSTGEVKWTFWGKYFEDLGENPNAHLSSFFEGNILLNDEHGKLFVYAGSDDNRLYKLDADGNLIWAYDTESYPSGVIWTRPLVSPDGATIFIGALSGQVHAVDAATGERKWKLQVEGPVVSSLAMGMYGEIFFGSFDGKIYCIDPEDGSIFWKYQTMGIIYASPAITSEGSVVIGSSDGGVYCLDRFGKKLWTYYTDAPIKSSAVIDPAGCAILGNQNGKIYCLTPEGARLWSYHASDAKENDINSSPSLGADGTVYAGLTTGEVVAIPHNYYLHNRKDKKLCLDPGHDGERPDVPPDGARLAIMDRFGTPIFDAPKNLHINDNLNLILFAVNSTLDVIPAEIIPGSVSVNISPELKFDFRVDSMGKYIYILPDEFLEYGTEYTISAKGKYMADGRERAFDCDVKAATGKRKKGAKLPWSISEKSVPGVVIKGFTISHPKEIDALGQAALDAHNYAMTPIYIDEKKGHIAVIGSSLIDTGGVYEYAPRTINKLVSSGVFKDGYFKISGSVHVNAQGANTPLDNCVLSGLITGEPGIENGITFNSTSIHNMPDFVDLIRVMKLADSRDDVVGFCTFTTLPLDTPAMKKPTGVSVEADIADESIAFNVKCKNYKVADHWIQLHLIDAETGDFIDGNRVEIRATDAGVLKQVFSTLPVGLKKGNTVAVLTLDLFPMATVKF